MAEAEGVPNVDVSSIAVSPNQCAIEAELDLKIDFTLDKAISNSVWEIKYIVDYTNKRKELVMGKVEAGDYAANTPHQLQFNVPTVDVTGIRESLLLNVGLLLAVLYTGEEEVIQISMMTQVTKTFDGKLHRNIFNPLE
eukprot:TRINITY_DN4550_c0_g1_i1.p1 TRINITY_DN4550_c0_g1~~TRINITY_DN4550_c0_g1_i1.p1  ORF type:complete len:139 (-),score=51.93 TRINITY_DN4550_c0_g1_i1:294-710(-)